MARADRKGISSAWVIIALVAAVIMTIWIEYVMITQQSYKDWADILIAIQVYVIVTCITIFVYMVLFRRRARDVLGMIGLYNIVIAIPLGILISMKDGYTIAELLTPNWVFTHDFFYVIMVCQAFVTWILLLATTKSIDKAWKDAELGEEEYFAE